MNRCRLPRRKREARSRGAAIVLYASLAGGEGVQHQAIPDFMSRTPGPVSVSSTTRQGMVVSVPAIDGIVMTEQQHRLRGRHTGSRLAGDCQSPSPDEREPRRCRRVAKIYGRWPPPPVHGGLVVAGDSISTSSRMVATISSRRSLK